ncbi:hypothetical protein M513_11333 [Trichuris suis]|uniref:Uncharacterized protein n=1 Tax=Trichuris suis TaxID=68888 RepID=A0A085LS37_9BILA|nr:hypothetical protein M513_11333 [Trichuris suis]
MATVKNIRWLYKTIKDEETAAQFLCERGLLHSEKLCPVCGETMRLGRGGIAWCCYKRSCRREVSIRMGTWFENKRTKRSWNSMCQTATYRINKSVTARWNRHLRQAIAEALAEAPVQLGRSWSSTSSCSPGASTTEARGTHSSGASEAHAGKLAMPLLYPWRNSRLRPCCPSYRGTSELAARATGAHTQSVESLWAQAKRGNKRRCGTHRSALPSHLCEFTWRKRLAASDDAFDAILADILLLRPPRSDGIAYVHPSAAVNAHRSGTYGSRWQCKESRGGTPFDVAEITSGQALYVKAPYSNSLKAMWDSLHRTCVCSEPEHRAACSATADAANARSMAMAGGTDDGLPLVVVVEWPASSSSCSARMYRLRWLMCCENLRLSVNPVSPMEAAEQEHLTPFYDHENVVYIPFEQAIFSTSEDGTSDNKVVPRWEAPSLRSWQKCLWNIWKTKLSLKQTTTFYHTCSNGGIRWEDLIRGDVMPRWTNWKRQSREIKFDRFLRIMPNSNLTQIEMRTFYDVSESAYDGQTGKWKLLRESTDGETRAASVKRVTNTSTVGTRLTRLDEKDLEQTMQSVHYWSDGKVALSWIKSEAKNWKQCFRNRAEEIHQDNPADLVSRGLSVRKLKDATFWWHDHHDSLKVRHVAKAKN